MSHDVGQHDDSSLLAHYHDWTTRFGGNTVYGLGYRPNNCEINRSCHLDDLGSESCMQMVKRPCQTSEDTLESLDEEC